jgi:hypothetical protein
MLWLCLIKLQAAPDLYFEKLLQGSGAYNFCVSKAFQFSAGHSTMQEQHARDGQASVNQVLFRG